MSTRDLIHAISSGNAIGIESSFNAVIAEKISAKLDVMRQEVAQNLFAEEIEGLIEIEEEVKIGKLDTHSGTNNYGGYYHHNVTHNGKNIGRVKQNIDDAPDIYGHPGHPKSWSFTHNSSKHDSEDAKGGYFKTKEDAAKALVNHHSSYMKKTSK